jgi:hypothetical protein
MIHGAGGGHLGNALPSGDTLTALYCRILCIDPSWPDWAESGRFVLSTAHAWGALHAVLAERGYFPVEELATFDQFDSRLQSSLDMYLSNAVPRCYVGAGHLVGCRPGQGSASRSRPADVQRAGGLGNAPWLATVGVRIPPKVLPSLEAFGGEHVVERVIMEEPQVVTTAWLGERCMIGAMCTNGATNPGGPYHHLADVGQSHAGTMYWLTPDGSVGWVRLARCPSVDAVAPKERLEITCSGDAVFQVYAPGLEDSILDLTRWTLPGLAVAIASDAQDWRLTWAGDALEITFRDTSKLALSLQVAVG